jgi:hypothetical protein
MRPNCVASGFLFPVGSGRRLGSHRGRIGDQLADATKRPATVSGQRDAAGHDRVWRPYVAKIGFGTPYLLVWRPHEESDRGAR